MEANSKLLLNLYQYILTSHLDLVRRKEFLSREQSTSRTITLVTTNICILLILSRKHGKWKSINGTNRTALNSDSGHRLRRVQCRKGNSIQQQEKCSKYSRLSCTHMLQVYTAIEGTTTSYYLWPPLLQALHRTTYKWKVIIGAREKTLSDLRYQFFMCDLYLFESILGHVKIYCAYLAMHCSKLQNTLI